MVFWTPTLLILFLYWHIPICIYTLIPSTNPIEIAYGKKAGPSVELAVKVQKSEKNMTLRKEWSLRFFCCRYILCDLQYANNMIIVCIPSINAIRKVEICWIMYQSSHNVRRGQNLSRQVFKVENRNNRSFSSLGRTVLGNTLKIICSKYQCNRKTRSVLNHVLKFAQCETRSKFVKKSFQSRKPKQKIWNSRIFQIKYPREHCKDNVYRVPM